MNRVFVVNKEGKALMPCHPARARVDGYSYSF